MGYPDAEHIWISKSDWAVLVGYVAGLRNWIIAAGPCLEDR